VIVGGYRHRQRSVYNMYIFIIYNYPVFSRHLMSVRKVLLYWNKNASTPGFISKVWHLLSTKINHPTTIFNWVLYLYIKHANMRYNITYIILKSSSLETRISYKLRSVQLYCTEMIFKSKSCMFNRFNISYAV